MQEVCSYLTLAKSLQKDNKGEKTCAQDASSASSSRRSDSTAPIKPEAGVVGSDHSSSTQEGASKKRGRSKNSDSETALCKVGSSNPEAEEGTLASRMTYVGETQFLFSHIKQTMKVFVLR